MLVSECEQSTRSILDHAENGGNGIKGEQHIGASDHEEYQEYIGNEELAVMLPEEMRGMRIRIEGEQTRRGLVEEVVSRINLLIVIRERHLVCSPEKNGPEEVDHEMELLEKVHSGNDEHDPQDDGKKNPELQESGLAPLGHPHQGEDHDEDEEVVDGEGILREVSGEVLHRYDRAGTYGGVGILRVVEQDRQSVEHRYGYP